jgi:glycosyltransferase involved in cell wall biosynthesis
MAESVSINKTLNLSEIKKDLPRLLLVSEASLDSQRTGLNRTLLNLFAEYPADRFMVYSPKSTWENYPTSPPLNQNVATFPDQFLPRINNRIGSILNPIFQAIDSQLLDSLPIAEQEKIREFAPEVILICPVGIVGLLMGYKVAQSFQCPFISYFMDDILYENHQRWLSGELQSLGRNVLEKASAWLMISSQLEKELINRYQLTPKRSLIVHNPVDLSNKSFPEFSQKSGETFRVVYAGAIWTMHYDALAVIAEAIYELKCSGVDIELVLHTAQNFWDLYQENWQKWDVKYGSFIPYEHLNQALQKADLLLVVSSFLPEHAHITRSSVQTKLTDYMASGRLILSCGPSYAACNLFVKNWNCGIVGESNQVAAIKKILLKQIEDPSKSYTIIQNAFKVLLENFETSKVRSKLYDFIKQIKIVESQLQMRDEER